MERRVIVITGRHRPHELLLLVYGTFIGITTLAGERTAVSALMPTWVVTLWALCFVLSGIVGLFGAWWRSSIVRGLWLELGGMLLGAAATALYSASVFTIIKGWQGIIGSGLVAAWGIANMWRATQIRLDLKKITEAGNYE